MNKPTTINMAITKRLAGEKKVRTFIEIKSGTLKSVSITVFSSAANNATPRRSIRVPTVKTIALTLRYAMKYPCIAPIKVETDIARSNAVTAPRLSVKRTTITAAKAALEPIDRSISPAIMQRVNANPTNPRTANRSIMA